jgi:hypothetical protein
MSMTLLEAAPRAQRLRRLERAKFAGEGPPSMSASQNPAGQHGSPATPDQTLPFAKASAFA